MKGSLPDSPKLSSLLKSIFNWSLFLLFLFLIGTQLKSLFPSQWQQFIYGVFGTLAALLATWILIRSEKKSFAEYGLVWKKDTLLKFIKGFVLGTCIFMIIILILISFTELQFDRNPKTWNPWALFWYLAIVPLALMEEVAFRSYSFSMLNKAFGLRFTQLIVAVAFALYHIIQGWDFQIAFLGPGAWAFVFGLAAVWSNGIALPTGIHVALNLMQSLMGLKHDKFESLWLLQHSANASAEAIAFTNTLGLLTQGLVFISAILLTEYYLRNKVNDQ